MVSKSLISKKTLCPQCNNPSKKNGSFLRKRSRAKIQRFYCEHCSLAFSKQSKSITSRQHRPDLNEKIFEMLCNGVGVRRIAQSLKTTPKTVQNKIKFLAIICDRFHNNHFINWKVKPRFQFDEMWAVEGRRENTLTIPLVVEKESYFIVSSRSAHTYSKTGIASIKGWSDLKRKAKIDIRDIIILKTLDRVNKMKPNGRIVMDTDKATMYPYFLSQVFGSRLIHNRYNAGIKAEAMKLFPVNNTMACMRAEISKVKREGWYQSQDNMWLNAHLAIYTVYYNYFRVKKYTVPNRGLSIVSGSGKVKKTFEYKTPAMKLGIFDKPISFRFLMDSCTPKDIPVKGSSVPLIGYKSPLKKSA